MTTRAKSSAPAAPANRPSAILEAAVVLLRADGAALLGTGPRRSVAVTGAIGESQLADLLGRLERGERFPQTIEGRQFALAPLSSEQALAVAYNARTRFTQREQRELELFVELATGGNQRQAQNRRLLAVSNIQQSISAQSPLSEVFRAIYERAAEEIDTPTFIAATYDSAAETASCAYAMQDGVERLPSDFPPRPLAGPLADAIRTAQPQLIDDTAALPDASRAAILGDGHRPVRSMLIVPMVHHNEVKGVVEAQSYHRAAFSEDDIYLLSTLANQAAVALEGARLLEASREQVEQLTLLNQVSSLTSQIEDPAEAADRALALVVQHLHGIDMGITWEVDADEPRLTQLATYGFVADATPPVTLPLDDSTFAGRAALDSHSLVLQMSAETALPLGSRPYIERNHIQTLIEVPMRTGQRVIGVLTLAATQQRDVEQHEIEFLETLAGELGTALEAIMLNLRRDASRRGLQTIIENLPEAIAITDAEGRITSYNHRAEELWGHPALSAALDQIPAAYGLHSPDGRPLPWRETPLALALLERAPTSSREIRIRRPDGTEVPILSNCVPVHDGQGRITGAVEVFQDITKLKEIDRLKDDFVNTVSHELRTPTTTLRGGALTLLRRGDSLDETTKRQLLRDMSEEAERLHILVEDLLSLSRSQAGMQLTTEPVIPHRFVNHMILEMGSRVGDHSLTVRVPADLPIVEADPFCLEQIFRNLLENAVKFSPGGQRIEIEAEPGDDEVIFSVLDRGSGIPAKDLGRVFEPFYRSDEVVSAGAQGAGLGLAVCERFVHMQGGRIWTESRAGGGTVFRFTIPVVPEPAGEELGDEDPIGLA
jgi:PAS domain S-box-containing protein